MWRVKLFLIFQLLAFLGPPALAAYEVGGKVNLGEEWQPRLFMAAIEKLSDYYRASPDLIVNIADINPDGSFLLSGDNLPDDPRFYRLYLMKKQK